VFRSADAAHRGGRTGKRNSAICLWATVFILRPISDNQHSAVMHRLPAGWFPPLHGCYFLHVLNIKNKFCKMFHTFPFTTVEKSPQPWIHAIELFLTKKLIVILCQFLITSSHWTFKYNHDHGLSLIFHVFAQIFLFRELFI